MIKQEDIWHRLYDEGNKLCGPYLIPALGTNAVTYEHVGDILRALLEVSGDIISDNLRGYVFGRQDFNLPGNFLALVRNRGATVETIEQAFSDTSTIFGQGAGLIVNGGLQWSDKLQRDLSLHTGVLSDLIGNKDFSLNVIFFMGSYQTTPFGAHVDNPNNRTVLFNLGPGEKEISIWSRDIIEGQFGKIKNVFEIDSIISTPSIYIMKCGDIFALPSSEFHVASNRGFSTSAALVVEHLEYKRLAAREMQHLSSDIDSLSLSSSNGLMKLSLNNLVSMNRLRILSNNHLRYAPPVSEVEISQIRAHSIMSTDMSFKPQCYRTHDTMILYSRGRHIFVPTSCGRIERLFLGEAKCVREFLAIAEAENLTNEGAWRLLRFLTTTRILQFGPGAGNVLKA